MSYKTHFSRALGADPGRLHVAAHSHHPWPDVTRDAQLQAWDDAAAHLDGKWDRVFGQVVPEAAGHVARRLGLPDPRSVVFAPNTHDLLLRVLSCLPRPPRVLTTDAEFHSFTRQMRRLEESGDALVERVPAEPFDSFPERIAAAAAAGDHDLVFVSHVHFDSGYVHRDLAALVGAVDRDETYIVVDGYHGFMAVPTDLGPLADRVFYLAGGYKYAMAGEGVCFLHAPPGYGSRPVNTGWYAEFGKLTRPVADAVGYPETGWRFAGSTFDPTALYRFNAVQRWLTDLGVDVAAIHAHVAALQRRFLDHLARATIGPLEPGRLIPGPSAVDRGHFLTFRVPDAAALHDRLARLGVVTDHRGDRLRLGFGLYHDPGDIDVLWHRLQEAAGSADVPPAARSARSGR